MKYFSLAVAASLLSASAVFAEPPECTDRRNCQRFGSSVQAWFKDKAQELGFKVVKPGVAIYCGAVGGLDDELAVTKGWFDAPTIDCAKECDACK